LKNWEEGLAATNADEIKQLRGGQTLRSTPRHRQKEWDNYKNRGLREGETHDSLCLGRVIRSQDAVNIVSQIRGDQSIGNREDSNQNQCNSRTSHHGRYLIAPGFVPVKENDWFDWFAIRSGPTETETEQKPMKGSPNGAVSACVP
jgi:hypothetical protein